MSVERLRWTDESSAAALCAQALSAIGAIGGSSKAALSVGLVTTSIGVGSVSTYMSTVRTDLTTVHSRGRGRAAQLWPYYIAASQSHLRGFSAFAAVLWQAESRIPVASSDTCALRPGVDQTNQPQPPSARRYHHAAWHSHTAWYHCEATGVRMRHGIYPRRGLCVRHAFHRMGCVPHRRGSAAADS